jgi:hypothetical protein
MTAKFSTISPMVRFIGLDGRVKSEALRPLRVLPKGAGFGVVRKGHVLPVQPAEGGMVAICKLDGPRFAEAECRAAKMADIGMATKAEAKAAAPAAERTPAQRAATVAMLTRALATAKASGDATRIAKAEKALATAKANLVTPPKAAKAAKAEVAPDVETLATALKASGVDLISLIQALSR